MIFAFCRFCRIAAFYFFLIVFYCIRGFAGREFFKTYRYGYRFLNFKLIGIVGTVYGNSVKCPALYFEVLVRRCGKGYGFIRLYFVTALYFRFTYLCGKGAPPPRLR